MASTTVVRPRNINENGIEKISYAHVAFFPWLQDAFALAGT